MSSRHTGGSSSQSICNECSKSREHSPCATMCRKCGEAQGYYLGTIMCAQCYKALIEAQAKAKAVEEEKKDKEKRDREEKSRVWGYNYGNSYVEDDEIIVSQDMMIVTDLIAYIDQGFTTETTLIIIEKESTKVVVEINGVSKAL